MAAINFWLCAHDARKPLPQALTLFAANVECFVDSVVTNGAEYSVTIRPAMRSGAPAVGSPVADREFRFKTDTPLTVGQLLTVDFLVSSVDDCFPSNVRLA